MKAKNLLFGIALLLLGFTIQAQAQQMDMNQLKEQYSKKWFFSFSTGAASMAYNDDIDEILKLLKDNSEVETTAIDLDLGIYKSISEKMSLGIAVNMAGDRYSLNDDWFQINQYLYAVSAITHLNKQFDGFYLRTDLGLANFVITDSDSNSEATDSGYGILVGVGYSFNLFTNFRMAPYANFKYSKVEDSDDSKIAFGVKFIF